VFVKQQMYQTYASVALDDKDSICSIHGQTFIQTMQTEKIYYQITYQRGYKAYNTQDC